MQPVSARWVSLTHLVYAKPPSLTEALIAAVVALFQIRVLK
jgi:hypothetical protein